MGPSRSHRRETVLPATPNHHKLPPSFEEPNPRPRPRLPKQKRRCRCHLPLSPHTPHPLPYPHAHAHAPDRNRPSSAGRGTSTPPASDRRCSPTPQAEGAGLALPRCGCRACPALFPFVDFGPSFTEALGLTFGPRPVRYDLSPFSDRFNTPQRGPRPLIRSVPGKYDSSPFVDLSVAPQSQAAPRPSRHGPPENRAHTIHLNSNPTLRRSPMPRRLRVQGSPCRLAALPPPQASCTVRGDAPRD